MAAVWHRRVLTIPALLALLAVLSLSLTLILTTSWNSEDVPVMQPTQTWNMGSPVTAVALSPDGQYVAVGLDNGHIQLRQASDGTVIWDVLAHATQPDVPYTFSQVRTLLFSHDGRMLASAGNDRRMVLWQAADGKELQIWNTGEQGVRALAFSPNNAFLATSGPLGSINIFNTSTGDLSQTLPGASDSSSKSVQFVLDLAFSADRRTLTSVTDDDKVYMWRVPEGTLKHSRPGIYNNITLPLVLSAHGELLAGGAQAEIYVSKLDEQDSSEPYTLTGHRTVVSSIAFSSDGLQLASGGSEPVHADYPYRPDTNVHVWDLSSGLPTLILKGHTDTVNSIAWGPDNNQLVSGSKDGTVRVWSLK